MVPLPVFSESPVRAPPWIVPLVWMVPEPTFSEEPLIAPPSMGPLVWIVPEPAFTETPTMAPAELMVALPLFTLRLFVLTLIMFPSRPDSVPPETVPVV